jgi:hypothetical protein
MRQRVARSKSRASDAFRIADTDHSRYVTPKKMLLSANTMQACASDLRQVISMLYSMKTVILVVVGAISV